jgi:hypothetical protein
VIFLVLETGVALEKNIGFGDDVVLKIFFLGKENPIRDINSYVRYKSDLVYVVIDRGGCD